MGGEFDNSWDRLEFTASNFVSVGFLIATIIFVFIFIIGSFQWITSGSDKSKLAEGKTKITHAIVGLIVLLLIFFITQVINLLLGLNIGRLGKPFSSEMGTIPAPGDVTLPTPTDSIAPSIVPSSEQQNCEASGGSWIEFPDSCADRCDDTTCLDATYYSCDCGDFYCWDGDSCIYDPDGSPMQTPIETPAMF